MIQKRKRRKNLRFGGLFIFMCASLVIGGMFVFSERDAWAQSAFGLTAEAYYIGAIGLMILCPSIFDRHQSN